MMNTRRRTSESRPSRPALLPARFSAAARRVLLGALLVAAASSATAGEVVVLKGGTVVQLKEHWVRRGNTAYLTRADGTLLSVPVSEIDREKTAAANRTVVAPAAPAVAPAPSSPAEIARAPKDSPKAKVRITDADVSHPLDLEAAAAPEEKKEAGPGGPKVEVSDWSQEKNGEGVLVRGSLRNVGQGTAEGVRLQISAIDEKGQAIDGTSATLSKGSIDAGGTIDFNGSMKVPADRNVATIRFAPQWTSPRPPAAAAPARPGAPAAATGAPAAAAKPAPTPYGRGTLYAAPVANAPSQAPADGKTGYIPGATSPDNQPKPPSR